MTTTARPANPSRPHEEIWECTIPGRISMNVSDGRGGVKDTSVHGEGQVLRITTMDRELAEEVIRDPENNPFTNGALVRVDANKQDHVAAHDELSTSELTEMFELDNADFEDIVPSLSQVNVRRLKAMAVKVDARSAQILFLDEHIAANYAVGGSTKTYDEMKALPLS